MYITIQTSMIDPPPTIEIQPQQPYPLDFLSFPSISHYTPHLPLHTETLTRLPTSIAAIGYQYPSTAAIPNYIILLPRSTHYALTNISLSDGHNIRLPLIYTWALSSWIISPPLQLFRILKHCLPPILSTLYPTDTPTPANPFIWNSGSQHPGLLWKLYHLNKLHGDAVS